MEVVELLSTLIANIGFPIAAFILMYYMCFKTLGDMRDTISESNEKVTETLTELKTVISGLSQKLGA